MQTSRSTPAVPDPLPTQLRLPATEITTLLARGDALFAQGDISSARLFYERAADAGEGRAALRLGKTFDPVFLDFAHLRVRGDAAMAVSWYGRALELGEAEAEILLKRLEPAR
jgi:TPR repeat protein